MILNSYQNDQNQSILNEEKETETENSSKMVIVISQKSIVTALVVLFIIGIFIVIIFHYRNHNSDDMKGYMNHSYLWNNEGIEDDGNVYAVSPVKVYRLIAPNTIKPLDIKKWYPIPKLTKTIVLKKKSNIEVTYYASANNIVADQGYKAMITINNQICAMKDMENSIIDYTPITPYLHPVTSICSKTLNPGKYNIKVVLKRMTTGSTVNVPELKHNGLLINVYERIPITQWKNINLNDRKEFDALSEYRILVNNNNWMTITDVSRQALKYIDCNNIKCQTKDVYHFNKKELCDGNPKNCNAQINAIQAKKIIIA